MIRLLFECWKELDVEHWYHRPQIFFKKGTYPSNANAINKRMIRRLAYLLFLWWCVIQKILWKYNVRSVDAKEANEIISEVHKGVFDLHMSGDMLARKVLRMDYYWSIMENDCFKHVKKCHFCQIYNFRICQPPTLLHNMSVIGLALFGAWMQSALLIRKL